MSKGMEVWNSMGTRVCAVHGGKEKKERWQGRKRLGALNVRLNILNFVLGSHWRVLEQERTQHLSF